MNVYRHPSKPDMLAATVDTQIRTAVDGKPIVEYIGSDDSEDRYGSILDPNGWEIEAYKRNPVVLFAHDYSRLPIGRAISIEKTRTGLKFRVEFAVRNAFARDVYELVRDGFLPAVSVGFIPKETRPLKAETVPNGEGVRYTKQELLELSVVPVPANRNALTNAYARGHLRESTIVMAGRSFRGFLNGHEMFPMRSPIQEWEPSSQVLRAIESYVRGRRSW